MFSIIEIFAVKSDQPFQIVGIGASAGGLRALEDFFKTLPADSGMAFVIITHLAPDRESYLTDILARNTALAFEVAREGQKIEQNRVYVLPPNASLTIAEGRLRLRDAEPGRHERNPIDVFFASLAQDCGEYAVGIILSGSGHDGVLGVKAIKEQGGLVLAQAGDQSGPGFAGMPDSAIASGLVDFAVPVDAMAAKLLEHASSFQALDGLAGKQPRPMTNAPTLTGARRSTRSCAPRPAMISAATRRELFCDVSSAGCRFIIATPWQIMQNSCSASLMRPRLCFATF